MPVRAKFTVMEVTNYAEGSKIILRPVVDGSPENEEFYKWTPSGEIELSTINPDAATQFVPGQDYYVDFTPASDES